MQNIQPKMLIVETADLAYFMHPAIEAKPFT